MRSGIVSVVFVVVVDPKLFAENNSPPKFDDIRNKTNTTAQFAIRSERFRVAMDQQKKV